MGRGANNPAGALTTTEARRELPKLARKAARQRKPGKRLAEKAVRIQPQGEARAAFLISQVDLEEVERHIAELEDVLEDIELVGLLEERMGSGDDGDPPSQPLSEVIQEFAEEGLLSEADVDAIEAKGLSPAQA